MFGAVDYRIFQSFYRLRWQSAKLRPGMSSGAGRAHF